DSHRRPGQRRRPRVCFRLQTTARRLVHGRQSHAAGRCRPPGRAVRGCGRRRLAHQRPARPAGQRIGAPRPRVAGRHGDRRHLHLRRRLVDLCAPRQPRRGADRRSGVEHRVQRCGACASRRPCPCCDPDDDRGWGHPLCRLSARVHHLHGPADAPLVRREPSRRLHRQRPRVERAVGGGRARRRPRMRHRAHDQPARTRLPGLDLRRLRHQSGRARRRPRRGNVLEPRQRDVHAHRRRAARPRRAPRRHRRLRCDPRPGPPRRRPRRRPPLTLPPRTVRRRRHRAVVEPRGQHRQADRHCAVQLQPLPLHAGLPRRGRCRTRRGVGPAAGNPDAPRRRLRRGDHLRDTSQRPHERHLRRAGV
ncbi:MAG: Possible transcriptional regulatory protein, partial [uncultured Acidimicrobiales bacterium]